MLLAGCNGGGDGFSGVSEQEDNGNTDSIVVAVKIADYFPKDDPVIYLSGSEKTFAVEVNKGSGDVTYEFLLDNISQQNSPSAYYVLNSGSLAVGAHTLKVTATNKLGSSIHTYAIQKNRPPVIAFDSDSASTINCGSESYDLDVTASDQDGDSINFKFYLNGIENHSSLSSTSGASSASVTFSPNCTFNGSQVVRIKAVDSKGEEATYDSTVTVQNPNAVVINSYLPITNPTVIKSVDTTNFIISASGNAPLQYSWDISPGSTMASCNSLSTCPIVGTDFTPGRYTLTANVKDALNTTDDRAFTVVLNQKPQVTATPSNVSKIKMNCSSSKNFTLSVTDANFGDLTQTFTVNWVIDGNSNAAISATNVLNATPMTSNMTFSPNCDSSLLGDHTITAHFSDGHETTSISWPISINYFNDNCNTLASGQICTALGFMGMGSGLYTTTNSSEIRLQPEFIAARSAGGYFFSDINWNVVWFYNDTGAAITVLGQTVNAKQLKVVVGLGAAGNGTAGNALNYYLEGPRGLAFNDLTGDLYISDYSNNRIIKVNSSGSTDLFAGGGASNTDGATRLSHECTGPLGLALDAANDRLFVACYGGNTNNVDGSIKYFNLSTDTGYSLVRYQSTGNIEGGIGYNGAARTRRVYSIAKHPTKDIIFAGELEKCQVLAISYGGTESFYGGAVSLAANQLKILTNNTACGHTLSGSGVDYDYTNTSLRIRAYDIAPYMVSGSLKGLFVSNYNNHTVYFLNIGTTDVEYGGKVVESGYIKTIYGQGTADYSRNRPASTASYLRNPIGLLVKDNRLLISDRGNFRVASLDTSVANGNSTDFLGSLFLNDYDGEADKNTNFRQLYNPSGLTYDATNNSILVLDTYNARIRSLSLDTGRFKIVLGSSYGNANTDPELPLDVQMMYPRDITVTDDDNLLLYSEYNSGVGTNRNCLVRGFNRSSSDETYFNINIPTGKISSVAGNYAGGCQNWVPANENQDAIDVTFRDPFGIVSFEDQSKLFIANRTNHCIHSVDSSGVIKTEIGTCGTAGATSGAFASALLDNPGDMELDSDSTYRASGNFFVVDRSLTTTSRIRYVNRSGSRVTINSIDVEPGEIQTVITTDGYVGGVATYEDQICYTQGAGGVASTVASNVECLNRDTGSITLRAGKPSASSIKGATPHYNEEEGILASSAKLNQPWGVTFDGDGNLYISDYLANNIRMVKKWY